MLDVEKAMVLLQEEKYPFFSEEQLEAMCSLYDDMNEMCYFACLMKADAQDIKIGPIEIKNNSQMWKDLASMFYKKWMTNPENSDSQSTRSLTGRCIKRADEY